MNKTLQMTQESYLTLMLILVALAGFLLFYSCQGKKSKKETHVSQVNHPEWSKRANIYEVNIRQYTPEGTFQAFEKHLPRLKEMGVNILWLMPIHPIGVKNRKGTMGSYYSVRDYFAVNPDFGTMDDFKSLVNKAHDLDMYVILDWVANHSAWDNRMIEEHPEWYTVDSTGNFVSPYDWTDVADLNFNHPGLREYMTKALTYWIEEADIDGYRCDVAEMVPTDYWDSVRMVLENIKPVFMLAEAERPEHHHKAFDMSYGWEMHHILNQIALGEMNATHLEQYFIKNDTLFPQNSFRMYFTSNHDENSWKGSEYERMGDGANTFAALTFIVPGMPMIYCGQEAMLNKRLRFFEKDTINWENSELQQFYRILIQAKANNPALWNGNWGGNWKRIKTNHNKEVFAILRNKDKNKVLGIFNLSDSTLSVNLAGKKHTGYYTEIFTGEPEKIGKDLIFNLGPWDYLIFEGKE